MAAPTSYEMVVCGTLPNELTKKEFNEAILNMQKTEGTFFTACQDLLINQHKVAIPASSRVAVKLTQSLNQAFGPKSQFLIDSIEGLKNFLIEIDALIKTPENHSKIEAMQKQLDLIQSESDTSKSNENLKMIHDYFRSLSISDEMRQMGLALIDQVKTYLNPLPTATLTNQFTFLPIAQFLLDKQQNELNGDAKKLVKNNLLDTGRFYSISSCSADYCDKLTKAFKHNPDFQICVDRGRENIGIYTNITDHVQLTAFEKQLIEMASDKHVTGIFCIDFNGAGSVRELQIPIAVSVKVQAAVAEKPDETEPAAAAPPKSLGVPPKDAAPTPARPLTPHEEICRFFANCNSDDLNRLFANCNTEELKTKNEKYLTIKSYITQDTSTGTVNDFKCFGDIHSKPDSRDSRTAIYCLMENKNLNGYEKCTLAYMLLGEGTPARLDTEEGYNDGKSPLEYLVENCRDPSDLCLLAVLLGSRVFSGLSTKSTDKIVKKMQEVASRRISTNENQLLLITALNQALEKIKIQPIGKPSGINDAVISLMLASKSLALNKFTVDQQDDNLNRDFRYGFFDGSKYRSIFSTNLVKMLDKSKEKSTGLTTDEEVWGKLALADYEMNQILLEKQQGKEVKDPIDEVSAEELEAAPAIAEPFIAPKTVAEVPAPIVEKPISQGLSIVFECDLKNAELQKFLQDEFLKINLNVNISENDKFITVDGLNDDNFDKVGEIFETLKSMTFDTDEIRPNFRFVINNNVVLSGKIGNDKIQNYTPDGKLSVDSLKSNVVFNFVRRHHTIKAKPAATPPTPNAVEPVKRDDSDQMHDDFFALQLAEMNKLIPSNECPENKVKTPRVAVALADPVLPPPPRKLTPPTAKKQPAHTKPDELAAIETVPPPAAVEPPPKPRPPEKLFGVKVPTHDNVAAEVVPPSLAAVPAAVTEAKYECVIRFEPYVSKPVGDWKQKITEAFKRGNIKPKAINKQDPNHFDIATSFTNSELDSFFSFLNVGNLMYAGPLMFTFTLKVPDKNVINIWGYIYPNSFSANGDDVYLKIIPEFVDEKTFKSGIDGKGCKPKYNDPKNFVCEHIKKRINNGPYDAAPALEFVASSTPAEEVPSDIAASALDAPMPIKQDEPDAPTPPQSEDSSIADAQPDLPNDAPVVELPIYACTITLSNIHVDGRKDKIIKIIDKLNHSSTKYTVAGGRDNTLIITTNFTSKELLDFLKMIQIPSATIKFTINLKNTSGKIINLNGKINCKGDVYISFGDEKPVQISSGGSIDAKFAELKEIPNVEAPVAPVIPPQPKPELVVEEQPIPTAAAAPKAEIPKDTAPIAPCATFQPEPQDLNETDASRELERLCTWLSPTHSEDLIKFYATKDVYYFQIVGPNDKNEKQKAFYDARQHIEANLKGIKGVQIVLKSLFRKTPGYDGKPCTVFHVIVNKTAAGIIHLNDTLAKYLGEGADRKYDGIIYGNLGENEKSLLTNSTFDQLEINRQLEKKAKKITPDGEISEIKKDEATDEATAAKPAAGAAPIP